MNQEKTVMSTSSNKKVWDGDLKLNSFLTVPIVASFKSGEKMPNVKWTKTIEVKGKVKLHDFELYIQDLTRSPNRGLMSHFELVIDWKEGASKLGLESMKKVAKEYVENGRVGVAKVKTGIDLYVCPCSDTIINLLSQYGFFNFKDKTTFDNNNYLIGCVVWKRNQINHQNSLHEKSSGSSRTSNTSHIQLRSPISEQYRKNDPIEVWSPIRTPFESPPKNESYKNYFSDLIKSEDVLPYVYVPGELETSNPNLTGVTGSSSTTCDQNFHKRMMEEDMDISPQKKVCFRDDNHNFIPPLPAQIFPPFAKLKPDFTYLGPVLMMEHSHSHAKPDFTYPGPNFMRQQTHVRVHSKPNFTYLGSGFTR